MWFVFPQIVGLGTVRWRGFTRSAPRVEARAYLAHPLLGRGYGNARIWCLAIEGRTAREIFGSPDDLKFHSSMTLFAAVAEGEMIFDAALRKYFVGGDARTLEMLARDS